MQLQMHTKIIFSMDTAIGVHQYCVWLLSTPIDVMYQSAPLYLARSIKNINSSSASTNTHKLHTPW